MSAVSRPIRFALFATIMAAVGMSVAMDMDIAAVGIAAIAAVAGSRNNFCA
jgi:hypothetical protein